MSMSTIVKKMLAEEMKSLHVAFLAKILSVNGNKAKIQPLGLIKDYGGTAKKQSTITNVHIAESARCKIGTKTVDGEVLAIATPIQTNDIVLCVCCDRNIDAALKGENSLPPVGYHNKSDCVIVAII